ncbi:BA14K family protein [Ensifer sp. SSB1]|uniref:BA14K family protein n=1 Tax=Ensifer sp. SSB1 TaxID=2795385 RepID=UPI001A638A01|nr:BA14K family protein [Ensifer sp. SSB1]MBK5571436.1 BA14K family protein [Ensifer sp. SSB1]
MRRDHWREKREKQEKQNLKAGITAGAIGLALSAIIIGVAWEEERRRQNDKYRPNERDARGLARYRSYDSRSRTFIGRDGRRYECRWSGPVCPLSRGRKGEVFSGRSI